MRYFLRNDWKDRIPGTLNTWAWDETRGMTGGWWYFNKPGEPLIYGEMSGLDFRDGSKYSTEVDAFGYPVPKVEPHMRVGEGL